jgi:hypothetical protein
MNGRRIVLVVIVLIGLGVAYFLYGGHATPAGQPPLVSFASGDVTPLKTAFNNSAASIRVLVMLSPT